MLARLIMFATGESVANILNFGKKYMQVDSLQGNKIAIFFPSTNVCHFAFFFRLMNGNKLWEIPDRAFENLNNLEYMYVSHLAHFPSTLFEV